MPMTLDARITLPLSTAMIFFGWNVLKPGSTIEIVGDAPVFAGLRDYKGELFSSRRLERAYVHYGLLHALPATIWSVVMPLQFWDHLRKSRPRLHRFCGYTAFTCSFILAITGILFIPFDLSWSNPLFKMHNFYGYPLIPSLNLALLTIVFPAMMITGVRALYLARNKRFAEHRRWTTYHGISGYLISLERVILVFALIGGNILDHFKGAQKVLGTDRIRTVKEKSDAERALFSATVWMASFLCAMWALYVRQRNIVPRKDSSKAKIM